MDEWLALDVQYPTFVSVNTPQFRRANGRDDRHPSRIPLWPGWRVDGDKYVSCQRINQPRLDFRKTNSLNGWRHVCYTVATLSRLGQVIIILFHFLFLFIWRLFIICWVMTIHLGPSSWRSTLSFFVSCKLRVEFDGIVGLDGGHRQYRFVSNWVWWVEAG